MKKNSTLLILLCLTFTALASSEEAYQELGLSAGTVKVLSETSDNCTDGTFSITGEGEKQVLILGSRITIPLPNQDRKIVTSQTASKCKQDIQGQYVKGKLSVLTTVHSCPANLKRLESRMEEIVSTKDHKITYYRIAKNEFKIQCVFEWTTNLDKR